MNVGTNKPGIQISENIFETDYSRNILLLGNNQKINNFVLQNLLKPNNSFIFLDTDKEFVDKKFLTKDVVTINFNKSNVFYDPIKSIKNDSDIKFISNFILSSFKFKTKQKNDNLSLALTSFLYSIISYVWYHDNENISMYKIYETAEEALLMDNGISLLDLKFRTLANSETLFTFPIKQYFNFKTLDSKLQIEAITQVIKILKDLSNKSYFNKNAKNSINLSIDYLNEKNIIIIPNDKENNDIFKISDLLLIQILNIYASAEASHRQLTIFNSFKEININNILTYMREITYDNITRKQIILNKYDKVIHHPFLVKTLNIPYMTASININFKNITNASKFLKLTPPLISQSYQVILETEENEKDIKFLKELTNYNDTINVNENDILVITPVDDSKKKTPIVDDALTITSENDVLDIQIDKHLNNAKSLKRNTNSNNWHINSI